MGSSPEQTPSRPIEGCLEALQSLLGRTLQHGGFDLTFAVRRQETARDDSGLESPEVVVEFSGADSDLLLQANAELLNALEYVMLRALRLDEEMFGRVTFDCNDWRRLRVEELKLTAQVAAERVIETGDPFPLGPMNPRERRIIHLALKDQTAVRTASEGYGAERRVVVIPASSPAPSPSRRR